MFEPTKLPVEMWAEKRDGRTRVIVKVGDDAPLEVFSWPEGLEKQNPTSDPANVIITPLST